MAIRVEQVTLACTVSGTPGVTTQDFTVAGLGAAGEIKLALFWVSQGAAVGVPKAPRGMGFGAADGTAQRAFYDVARGGQASAVTNRDGRSDACITVLTAAGALDGHAAFDSFITDGVRVVWNDFCAQPKQVTALLFADDGSDLEVAVGQGASSATLGGTTPIASGLTGEVDFLLTFGGNHPFDGTPLAGSLAHFGVLVNPGTGNGGITQHCLAWGSENAAPAGDPAAFLDPTHALAVVDGTDAQQQVALINFDATGGFLTILQGAAGAVDFGFVAMRFGGAIAPWAGILDTPVATGETGPIGPTFKPQVVGLLMSQLQTDDAYRDTAEAGAAGFGLLTETAESSICAWDEDAADPTNCDSLASASAAELRDDAGAASILAGAAATRFSPAGFDLDFTAVEAASRKWIAWALAAPAVFIDGVLPISATTGVQVSPTRRRAAGFAVAATSSLSVAPTIANTFSGVAVMPAMTSTGTMSSTASSRLVIAATSIVQVSPRVAPSSLRVSAVSSLRTLVRRRRAVQVAFAGVSAVAVAPAARRATTIAFGLTSSLETNPAGASPVVTFRALSFLRTLVARRRATSVAFGLQTGVEVAPTTGGSDEPTPPEFAYPTTIDFHAYPDRVERPNGTLIANTTSAITYLLANGYLDNGGAVGIFGKLGTNAIRGAHGQRVDEPIHLVGLDADAGFNRLDFGKGDGNFAVAVCWDLTFVNVANAYSPIQVDDDHSGLPVEPAGMIALIGCTFRGEPDAYIWHGEFPAKWWINGKGSASYLIRNCIFPPVHEHHHYLHYAQVCYCIGNYYNYTGGTAGQWASRAGRPADATHGPYYYGNPYQPPAGSLGPLLVKDCVHDDGTAYPANNYRDGSSFTVVGWLNDVWIVGCRVFGNAVAAIVIWTDYFKGAHATDGETYVQGYPPEPPPSARTHKRAYIRDLIVGPGDHDRAIIMTGGCEGTNFGSITIDSVRPITLIDSEYSGARENGAFGTTDFCFEDEQFILDYEGRIGTYDYPTDSTHWYTAQELQDHLCLITSSYVAFEARSFLRVIAAARRAAQVEFAAQSRTFCKLVRFRSVSMAVAAASVLEVAAAASRAARAVFGLVSQIAVAPIVDSGSATNGRVVFAAQSGLEVAPGARRAAQVAIAATSAVDVAPGRLRASSLDLPVLSSVAAAPARRRATAVAFGLSSTIEVAPAVDDGGAALTIGASSGVDVSPTRRRATSLAVAASSTLAATGGRRRAARSVFGLQSSVAIAPVEAPEDATLVVSAQSEIAIAPTRRRAARVAFGAQTSLETIAGASRPSSLALSLVSGFEVAAQRSGEASIAFGLTSELIIWPRVAGGEPGPNGHFANGRIRQRYAAVGVVAQHRHERGRIRREWKETSS